MKKIITKKRRRSTYAFLFSNIIILFSKFISFNQSSVSFEWLWKTVEKITKIMLHTFLLDNQISIFIHSIFTEIYEYYEKYPKGILKKNVVNIIYININT